MAIVAALGLIGLGAVLYFATNLHVAEISIDVIALIPMLAGLFALLVELLAEGFWERRRRARRTG